MRTIARLTVALITAGPALLCAQGMPATPGGVGVRVGAMAPATTCPNAEQVQRIAAAYAATPAPMPFAAAPTLKLAESLVAAGMPATLGRSVDGAHFSRVWESLARWPDAMVLIMKGGNVFEISTRIPAGEQSTRSRFFNLGEAALTGHLRPDLVTAIHGVQLPTGEGFVRGVFFYDASGESVFGAFVRGEGREEPSAEQLAAFNQTWQLLQSLPARCAAATAR